MNFYKLFFVFVVALRLLTNPLPVFADDKTPQHLKTTFSYTSFATWGTPTVEVKLNDRLIANFIFDTGTNTSSISGETAGKLGLSPQPATKDGRPYIMGDKQGWAVTLSQMQLGGFIISDIPLIVNSLSTKKNFSLLYHSILTVSLAPIFSHFLLSILTSPSIKLRCGTQQVFLATSSKT